jgi:hypothetical protein
MENAESNIERDDLWFCDRPERRFRLRVASEQEADRIGADVCHVVACKGGGIYLFSGANLPNDSDASLSTFLHGFGFFSRHQRTDDETFRRRTMAVSTG